MKPFLSDISRISLWEKNFKPVLEQKHPRKNCVFYLIPPCFPFFPSNKLLYLSKSKVIKVSNFLYWGKKQKTKPRHIPKKLQWTELQEPQNQHKWFPGVQSSLLKILYKHRCSTTLKNYLVNVKEEPTEI